MEENQQPTFAQRAHRGMNVTVVSLVINTFFAITKTATGILGNSYALIADGIESTLDIFSSTIVWGGLKIGSRPADANHPYGHGKAESLAAMAVSLALLGAAVGIGIQSVREILQPHFGPAPFTLIILVAVIVTKEILFRFISRIGEDINSLSLRVDAWHHRSDALTSFAALIGITIALIGGKDYANADDWAALFASGVIAFNGIRLLKSSIGDIMDEMPSPEIETHVRGIAKNVKGVVDVEKCRIRRSGLGILIEIHVEVKGNISVRQGHKIAHDVKDALFASNLGVIDTVIHIEPAKTDTSQKRK